MPTGYIRDSEQGAPVIRGSITNNLRDVGISGSQLSLVVGSPPHRLPFQHKQIVGSIGLGLFDLLIWASPLHPNDEGAILDSWGKLSNFDNRDRRERRKRTRF